MFDGASNFKLAGRLLKPLYPKWIVMHGFEHTVSLFFNYVSKVLIVHQIITAQNMIYNIFGSGICHNPHSILNLNTKSFTIKTLVFLA